MAHHKRRSRSTRRSDDAEELFWPQVRRQVARADDAEREQLSQSPGDRWMDWIEINEVPMQWSDNDIPGPVCPDCGAVNCAGDLLTGT